MDSKFFRISKKIIAIMMVAIICGTNVSSAFSFFGGSSSKPSSSIGSFGGSISKPSSSIGIFDKLKNALSNAFNFGSYDKFDLQMDLRDFKSSGNFDLSQLQGLVGKVNDKDLKFDLQSVLGNFESFSLDGILGGLDFSGIDLDLSSILSSIDLSGVLDLLLGLLIQGEDMPVDATTVTTTSVSAGAFAGDDYRVDLSAKVYKNNNSDKWAVLVHPFLLNGKLIAKALGTFYYDLGYNVIAVDLRGFGDSDGSMAMGFLDSLDVYDWVRFIRKEYGAKQIMIHGVSIGGSTVNYISGIDGFIKGKEKARIEQAIGETIKPLRELGVIGLVDDCGYTNMLQFLDSKDLLMGLGIGLTDETFDYYSDATNSLKYCTLPVMVIHGDADTTVKVDNAYTVINTLSQTNYPVKEEHKHIESGRVHAAIIMGTDRDTYGDWVEAFVKENENNKQFIIGDPPIQNDNIIVEDQIITDTLTTEKEGNFFDKIKNALKGLFNR